MKTFITFLFSAALLLNLTSCNLFGADKEESIPDPIRIELTPQAVELIALGNDFGIDLFTRTEDDEPGNLMLSPLRDRKSVV